MRRTTATALCGLLLATVTIGCNEILGIGDVSLPPASLGGGGTAGGAGGGGGGGGGSGGDGGGGIGGTPPTCDGCSGEHLWSKSFGDSGTSVGTAIAADGQGNVVIAGHTDGVIDFGDGPTSPTGDGRSLVVAKLKSDGELLWSKRFTGASAEQVQTMAVDGAGDIILVGFFDDSIDLDGQVRSSSAVDDDDAFVAKLSATDGSLLWLNAYGSAEDQSAQGVAVDAAGNIAVIGHFENAIAFDASAMYSSAGGNDVFLLTLDGAGNYSWSTTYATNVDELGRRVAYSGSDLIITGEYLGTLTIGDTVYPNGNHRDIFIAKVSPAEAVWAKHIGGNNDQHVRGLAVEGDRIVVTGGFESNLVFEGSQSITAMHAAQQHAVVLDGAGELSFMGALGQVDGGDDGERVIVAAFDSSEHVVLTGWFEGAGNFGGQLFQSIEQSPGTPSRDLFVAKLAADGTHFWSHRFGDGGGERGTAISTDPNGMVLLTGAFDGSIDLGQGHSCAASTCLFVAALAR